MDILKIHIFITFMIIPILLFAQDDYEKYLQEQDAALSRIVEDENEYLENITQEFTNYVRNQEKLYQDFKDAVEEKWGSFRFSTKKVYVDYDEDLNARSSINFDKGAVEVEVIVEDEPNKSSAEKKKAGEKLLQEKIGSIVTKKAEDKQLLLKDQLVTLRGEKVSSKNAGVYAKEIIEKQTVTKKKIKSKDGKTRVKYSVKIMMLPNHLEIRANRFKHEVLKQSKRFNIDPAVAFAIMHTESSFNPRARSHIPAYGLMQLVPESGARDAFNHVYKEDRLLKGSYLYVPVNNIELGCAYISKIRFIYFRKVKDEKSAYFCTISAYNTGAGNVARAMTGETRLDVATNKINSMNSDKVYKTLKKKLPYAETRNYLEKVTGRIEYYRAWI